MEFVHGTNVLCMTLYKVFVRKYKMTTIAEQSFNLRTLWENLNKVIFLKN